MQYAMGKISNISEYLDFGLYDHVSYKENAGIGMTAIGRWLGVYDRFGRLMSYWILNKKGTVISITTVQRIYILEKETELIKSSDN